MSHNPHAITRQLEAAVASYTGAPYVVAVNSCTMALLLATAWCLRNSEPRPRVEIPKRTYCSVPQAIILAGGYVAFRNERWRGFYQLRPFKVWDSARLFTSGVYGKVTGGWGGFACVSFHASKTLNDTQGGAILHDSPDADIWLRKARFDGRTEGVPPKDDDFDMIGWHCYLSPDVAARLLWKMSVLPKHNKPLPNDDYPDLSKFEVFK